MLIYNARVWRRLRALWSYNELGLINHSFFLNVAILQLRKKKYKVGHWTCNITLIKWEHKQLKLSISERQLEFIEIAWDSFRRSLRDTRRQWVFCWILLRLKVKKNRSLIASSGEITCLPPTWPGFDFRTRRDMLIEFVGTLLCSETFFPRYSSFPLSPKTNIWLHLICWTIIVKEQFEQCWFPVELLQSAC